MKYKYLIFSLILFFYFSTHCFAENTAILIKIDGAIGPSTAKYIESGIEYAEEKNSKALIIELNTPGGLLESTRDIVQNMLSSKVPIIVFVAPSGSRAGSAGVFITLAANIAVMAPGTNIGAAHPVGIGGQSDSSGAMYDKVTNDAAAFIRSIAQKRNRNQCWAERAVRESISSTDKEALDSAVIDFICPDIDSLLIAINGTKVQTFDKEITLHTEKIKVEFVDMSWKEKILSVISDPNIAYILLMIGIYGIFFELYSPGSIFPGVIGGISLILAAYSLQMLPINYAGLALIILAIILFIIEVKVASYGMLTVGGIISLFLGSIMLIDSPFEFMEISLSLILTVVILTALFFIFLATLGIRAQYRKATTGQEGMVGELALVISDITIENPGTVHIHGEIWKAVSDTNIQSGKKVVVTSIDSLTLFVKPLK